VSTRGGGLDLTSYPKEGNVNSSFLDTGNTVVGASGKKKKKDRPDPEGALSDAKRERLLTILDGVETASLRAECDDFCSGVVEAALGDGELALALARRLGGLATPLSVTILSLIMSRHADRGVVKEAKRSLFRLKNRGLEAPGGGPYPRAAAPTRAPAPGFAGAWAGVFDGLGRRFVTGAVKVPGGGLLSCAAVMSYEQGLVDWQTRGLTAKKWREFLALVREDTASPLVDLEAGHLRLLLEEARAATEAAGSPLPQSFFDFMSLLSTAPAPRPPVYDRIERDDVATDEAARLGGDRLVEEPIVAAWVLPGEALAPTLERIRTARGGTLVVSQVQQAEWIDEILTADLNEIFDAPRRRAFVRRLEETAFILAAEDRTEAARWALAAALEADQAASLADSAFFRALLDRSVRWHLPELAEDGPQPAPEPELTEGGLIIPGGVR
jgi:hypothetical protein